MTYEEVMSLNKAGINKEFGNKADEARKMLSGLMMKWHPDVSSHEKAQDVLMHLVSLRDSLGSGGHQRWPLRIFQREGGSDFGMQIISEYHDGLSTVMVANHSISRMFRKEDADLAEFSARNTFTMRFADDRMRAEMTKYLPSKTKVTRLKDGSVMLTDKRRQDQLPLSDLFGAKGPLDPRGAAWIVSGMMNIACWLEWSATRHLGISENTVMISPEIHQVSLFGGWEFSSKPGEPLMAIPDRAARMFPQVTAGGEPPVGAERKLIRDMYMRICGVRNISDALSGALPKEIAAWVTSPPPEKAVDDYEMWKKALRASYGEPKFIRMGVTPEDVYGR